MRRATGRYTAGLSTETLEPIRMDTTNQTATDIQLTGPQVLVHREGAEGAIAIDGLSGRIVTPPEERPDWAEGLAVAKLADRHQFYLTRLGPEFASKRLLDNPIAYEDLGWVGVDAAGEEMEFEASDEYRMNVIAEATGTYRTDDLSDPLLNEDIKGQQAYIVTDESHDYRGHEEDNRITSEAAKDSQKATGTRGG